jgi:2-desacetyl-2-hydroxyethyl bacteriochlorophyllide A dehydrogenase
MKAWVLPAYNQDCTEAIASLSLGQVPVPSAIPASHVLVKVEYASVNPIDWKLFLGGYHGFFPINNFPYVPGFDFSGTVVKAGANVAHLAVGDLVCGDSGLVETCKDPAPYGGPGGAFAEYIAVDAAVCAKLKPGADLRHFAALPLAGLTSYQALFTAGCPANMKGGKLGDLKAGDKVLIIGGAGGTGTIAIQLAKSTGATVYATCSAGKAKVVAELGAQVIDYTSQKWEEVLAGQDFDLIYDCVGQPQDFANANKVLKKDGKFVTIANLMDSNTYEGIEYCPFILISNKADLEALVSMVEDGKLKIPEAQLFELSEVPAALTASFGARSLGKNVIKVA